MEDQIPGRPRKEFRFADQNHAVESIKAPSEYALPSADAFKSQELAHEPQALHIDTLPTLAPRQNKER